MKKILSFLMIIGLSGAVSAANSGNQINPLIPAFINGVAFALGTRVPDVLVPAVIVGGANLAGMNLLESNDLKAPNRTFNLCSSALLGMATYSVSGKDTTSKVAIAACFLIPMSCSVAVDIKRHADAKNARRAAAAAVQSAESAVVQSVVSSEQHDGN